jgi:hypothetical protein
MPPTRTAIEGDVSLAQMRAWSARSSLFNSAWGFGLVLQPLAALVALINYIDGRAAARANPIRVFHSDLWLTGFYSNSLGVFIAGVCAYTLVRARADSRVVKAVLLAGLTYVFLFPIAATIIAVSFAMKLSGGIEGAQDFVGLTYNYWWDDFRAFGLQYVLGITCMSVFYLWLPLPHVEASPRQNLVRWPDLLIGGLLAIFGLALAFVTWTGIVYEIQKLQLLADANPPLRERFHSGMAFLEGELWGAVISRSLPFVLVGSLLTILSVPRSRRQ